ncbi:MAG: tripartite tricarboxylate transporter substrate binding protein [Burkholderiales bacterium]|nr:tripartite tricarboxylate transporter substrate binding protein [Burkholderiales bacterium]
MPLVRLLAVFCALLMSVAATAQTYPTRPVRMVIGFTPGGGVDINARLLASRLSEILGQSVVVENRPGAGTNIASELVAKAPADGHTLLMNTGAIAINMSLYKSPGYDTLRDFSPVSIFSESQNILTVSAAKPYRNVGELIAAARAKPGALTYGSAGAGSTQHLAGELFKLRTGTDILHVPYKGSAPALTALIAGEIDMVLINVPAIIGQVKSGRLRPLAAAGNRRSEQLADVPTLREAGVNGVESTVWYGVLAPAATPRDIIATLASAIGRAARAPETRQRLTDQGAEAVGSTPDEFAAILREDVARWRDVVRAAGVKPE